MDLGGKRDVMDTAKWMLTDKHNVESIHPESKP